jgi:hypothetical protein
MTPGATLGICLDDGHITIAARNPAGTLVDASAEWDGLPSTLVAAIDPLIAAVPAAREASIVLRRPLAHTRTLAMPRMPRPAAEQVLARDWARHVIGMRMTDHTVAAVPAGRGRWRAAFAPTDLLDALAEVARARGWTRFDVQAGDDVLAGAVASLARADSGDDVIAIVCDETGPTDACHVRGGAPLAGRRFLPHANAGDVADFAQTNASGALIAVLGNAPQANALARTLVAQGLRARTLSASGPTDTSTSTFAALAVTSRAGLQLRSPSMARVRARQFCTATLWTSTAAAVALIAALAMEQRRLTSDLDRIRQQRADLSGPVSNAIARRATVQSSVDLVTALAAREREASRTSDVLALVTLALPPGTALTLLNVAGDTLTVEGESARSAAVYQSLRALPLLSQVKLSAPLRQERQAGDVAVEHFAFNARIIALGTRPAQGTR